MDTGYNVVDEFYNQIGVGKNVYDRVFAMSSFYTQEVPNFDGEEDQKKYLNALESKYVCETNNCGCF